MLRPSDYRSPWYLPGADLQTIVPHLRRIEEVSYRRQRIELVDGDFVDVDWSEKGRDSLVIIAHGLEGHSRRPYILSTVRAFNAAGWDALAWNMRACSGEMNRNVGFYHAGLTQDLAAVLACAQSEGYRRIALVGFSLGGSLILKYLGECGVQAPDELCAAATFSVPCDLADSARALHRPRNAFYLQRFMRHLRDKVRQKARARPGLIDDSGLEGLRDLYAFDARFTAPMHGYASPEAYWDSNSCTPFLSSIRVPTLVVNARNDTFLGPACYPLELVSSLQSVSMEVPAEGGHIGFPLAGGACWMEERALRFIAEEA
jgi:predicted alpha/beta-fold hydrolase